MERTEDSEKNTLFSALRCFFSFLFSFFPSLFMFGVDQHMCVKPAAAAAATSRLCANVDGVRARFV